MKLQAQVGEKVQQVNIVRDGGNIVAKIDNREYRLESSEVGQNVHLFKVDGKIYEIFVTALGDSFRISMDRNELDVKIIDPKKLRGSGSNSGDTDGVAEIKTMMPGKVVRFVANPGQDVEKGDGVIVVEAMKMQNELKSPKAGTLKEFRVSEGDTVSAGDVLALVE